MSQKIWEFCSNPLKYQARESHILDNSCMCLNTSTLPYSCSLQWHANKTCLSSWNICFLSVHVLLASRLLGAVLPRRHPKYDNKNGSPKDHLWLCARHPLLPPFPFHFHSYPCVLEGVASEDWSSGLVLLLLFSVEIIHMQMSAINFLMQVYIRCTIKHDVIHCDILGQSAWLKA